MARILLVEDDLDVRPLLEHILTTEATYDVVSVESMANALALLDQQRFDLVITDVNLPDGSGLKVADKARARGVRALVFTGHGLSLEPGALAQYDYLLKPLHAYEFLEAVRRRVSPESSDVVRFPRRS